MGHIICIGRRYEDDWFFDCAFVGSAYECTGSIEYAGDEDNGDVGE